MKKVLKALSLANILWLLSKVSHYESVTPYGDVIHETINDPSLLPRVTWALFEQKTDYIEPFFGRYFIWENTLT